MSVRSWRLPSRPATVALLLLTGGERECGVRCRRAPAESASMSAGVALTDPAVHGPLAEPLLRGTAAALQVTFEATEEQTTELIVRSLAEHASQVGYGGLYPSELRLRLGHLLLVCAVDSRASGAQGVLAELASAIGVIDRHNTVGKDLIDSSVRAASEWMPILARRTLPLRDIRPEHPVRFPPVPVTGPRLRQMLDDSARFRREHDLGVCRYDSVQPGESVTIPLTHGDQVMLTTGVVDDTARRAFLSGQCHAMAFAMALRTGMPLVRVGGAVCQESDECSLIPDHWPSCPCQVWHLAVQAPNGRLLDVAGSHSEQELVEQWTDDDEDADVEVTLLTEHELVFVLYSPGWRAPEIAVADSLLGA